ncbi:unnamed protein product [Phaedon cochleariae]|uniref:Saccharopine dehydrogenase NADP binding domain-containing protein n=1 Tax=Phaedon cochleariae TaxID=80249 RepID=A0A9P0DZ04_PHACE|nr:unnamed protein product [Phaedon cochleariae]
MAADRLDLLVFGATGLTGKHVIALIHEIASSRSLTWGIAGRSEKKLEALLHQKGTELGRDFSRIPVIVADVTNEESLLAMAKKTKVLLNCCGPFRSLGRPVVEACIKAGTHQVDVNGEPQYMEKLQLEKHEDAERNGVYILSACAIDSIPCELGILHLQKEFDGVLNSVVTYFEEKQEEERLPGCAANYTTWASSITASSNWGELNNLRKKLFRTKMPVLQPKLRKRILPFRNDLVDGWMVPMPGPDHSVVERTQRYFYETKGKRPIQLECYYAEKGLWNVLVLAVLFLLFCILCRFEFGRRMLLNYPEIFSYGNFVKDEKPTQEKLDNTVFRLILCGEGWTSSEGRNVRDTQYSELCNGRIVGQVSGRNPWYGTTALCLVAAGVIVATESNKMPSRGGVYTPGAAFADTSMRQLLDQNGLTFGILSKKAI